MLLNMKGMKSMKKVLSLVMAAAVALSMTACGGNAGSSGTEATSQANSSDTTTTDNTSAALTPDSETGLIPMADRDKPFTFTTFVRDPGAAPAKDNPVLKKITELTGVTVQFEFLVGDLDQKIGVMIAGGDYPDVIMGDGVKYVDAGALIPLNDLLPKYPNLNDHYSPYYDMMSDVFGDGNMYMMEIYNVRHYPAPTFNNGGAGFFIQKAVIEESGNKIPHTIDEYFQMIEDYQKKYPEIDGVKTIGFEILCDGWRSFCLRNPAMHLLGDGNQGDVFVDPKTNVASYYQTSDTAKAYYKKLNEMYHKGLIEAETFTETYDQYISRLSTGAVLGMFDQRWNFQSGEDVLYSDGRYERTYISVPIANPGVQDGYLDAPVVTFLGSGGVGITVKCKEPERVLAFYDWLLQKDVQDYMQWGIKGVDYNETESGGKVLTAERRAIVKDTSKNRDLTAATLANYTPKKQGLYADGQPCGPADSVDEYLMGLTEYDQKFLAGLGVKYPADILSDPVVRPPYYPTWAMVIEDGSPAAISRARLADLGMKHYPQLILCEPSEYDAMWDTFIADWNANNVQPYLDEVNRQIQKILSNN